ncbi:MAG: HAD-IIIA family hydrolase [Bacteroidales bacterium]|nr:HAD-IIIA family hydrolase [Bacteroidales bacterium]
MKVIILAGGKGTRLNNLSANIPKSMIKIASKPVIQYQVELLRYYNFKDIYIIVNHLKDAIINFLGNGDAFGVNINYFQEIEPLGTVGGIKEIESVLKEDFLVLYGDVMINMDLRRLVKFHNHKNSDCTLVVHPNNHPYDSDLVEIDEHNRIINLHSKPHSNDRYYRNLVSAGLYVMSPLVLEFIDKGIKADFGKDIFPALFSKINMYGYNTAEYLKDMGTPERLIEVENDIKNDVFSISNYKHKRKAIFLDRDGVINKDIHFIHKTKDMELFPFTAAAIRKINHSGYLSVVVTNQSVIARNLCNIEQLQQIHNKMETLLGNEGAKLDAIYYCPHHPNSGYPEENSKYKIICKCRKPNIGMYNQAKKDLEITAEGSFMIGDSERDIIFGKNAGLITIGVMTGYGLKKADILPDFFFKDLLQAVNFIINDPYKSYFNLVMEKLQLLTYKKPFIINIGGNTRAGKSNFSNYLKLNFENKGYKVLIIELDKWIKQKDERTEKDDVFGRFRLDRIINDLKLLFDKKQSIRVPGYSHHPQRKVQGITYKINDEDIIIVEGIVALSNENIRKRSDFNIFMQVEKNALFERIFDFYRWKAYNDDDIYSLIEYRKKDEYNIIEKNSIFADIIIQSDSI